MEHLNFRDGIYAIFVYSVFDSFYTMFNFKNIDNTHAMLKYENMISCNMPMFKFDTFHMLKSDAGDAFVVFEKVWNDGIKKDCRFTSVMVFADKLPYFFNTYQFMAFFFIFYMPYLGNTWYHQSMNPSIKH